MAVAVKPSEPRTQGTPAAVQALSLVGLVLLLACLAAIFWLIPTYGPGVLANAGIRLTPYLQATVLGLVMLVTVFAFAILSRGVLGTTVPGVRAGIFVALVGLLGVLIFGTWFGGILEWVTFDKGWFGGLGKTVGSVTAAVVSAGLLLYFLRWFFATGTDKWLASFEEGGWFSLASYKPLQGLRVRRGTIIALLLLGGSGVYTLVSTNFLARFQVSSNELTETEKKTLTETEKAAAAARPVPFDGWSLGVPFTGTLTLRPPTAAEKDKGETGPFGDAGPLLKEKVNWSEGNALTVDRWFLRDEINAYLNPGRYIYLNLDRPEDFSLKNGVMSRAEFENRLKLLKDEGIPDTIDQAKDTRDPIPAGNPSGRKDPERLYTSDGNKFVTLNYTSIPLLPHVQFTLPLLLLALTLWLAWRIVNFPPFADFLIATEAELNKVSWTTRKRLFQDTIVVLVTLLLMAGFLLIVDLSCKGILGNEWVRVLQINPDVEAAKKMTGPRPW